jgi:alpha-1,3-rhamnosyl/mannosyltransferase
VFAFPSVYEGFGLTPLEAMAAGIPVVACGAGAVPEVLADAARLVAVGDADGLAEALTAVIEDPSLAADLVQRGHRRVAAFSWECCAAGLVDIYRAAVAAAGARS